MHLPLTAVAILALIAASNAAHPSFPPAACASCLRLRGGSVRLQTQQQQPTKTTVEQLPPEEEKPLLRRGESVLVLPDLKDVKGNQSAPETQMMYRIDGKQVTEQEYNERVKGVQQRSLDDWIALSDNGGLKEGDVIVPDQYSSIPEAIAAVAHNSTVYIRRGYYTWDGVLVVQKHMHLRGEPNPDEGIPGGKGRPTLEGQWLLGEKSSGSFKHVNCIARFDKDGRPQKLGPPPDLRGDT